LKGLESFGSNGMQITGERLKQDLPKVMITRTKPSEAQAKRLEQLFGKS